MTTLAARPDVDLTETSWTPRTDLTFEQWADAGRDLLRMGRAVNWWLGDWILYGERRYGEMYADAIDLTGLEYGTLANIVRVARHVESSRRREQLSWSHHVEVAALSPAEQDEWLRRADQDGLTVARLRARLSSSSVPETAAGLVEPEPPVPTHAVRISCHIAAESDAAATERAAELAALLERKGCRVSQVKAQAL